MFAGWLTIAMRVFTGSSPTARAAADFVLATLLRNRAHQTLVAINAALAVPIVAFAIARRGGSLEALMQPRRLVLWIPLVAVYAVAVGLRASFVVPSQLRASWTFIANGPEASRAYRTATRAVLLAVLLTVAGVMCAAVAPLVGVRTAVPHAAFVGLLTIALAEVVLLTLHQLPFIAPYAAGHARLRTRWPFYALGLVMFAWLPVQFEALAVRGRLTWSGLLGWTAAATVAAVGASLWRAHPWTISTAEEPEEHELVTLRVGELANS
jgi:hypothetical protein